MAALAHKSTGLDQGANGFLEEERIAATHEELLQPLEPRALTEESVEELLGAFRWQRVEAHLAVGR